MSDIKLILNKSEVEGVVKERHFKSADDENFIRSFWIALGVLTSEEGITIDQSAESLEIFDILKKMGADISFSDDVYTVKKSTLKGVEINLKDVSCLAPILAVVASQAEGKTTIENIKTVEGCLKKDIAKCEEMGVKIVKDKNSLEIEGRKEFKGIVIDPKGDHRTVMLGSLIGVLADGDTILEDPACVKKVYKEFFDDLRLLGISPIPITVPFGSKIKFSIFGDSHGKKIGLLLSGVPGDIKITQEEIPQEVDRRKSVSSLTTPRKEADKICIVQGIEDEKTTGGLIKIEIFNQNTQGKSYEDIKHTPRPGHADLTARTKYASVFDYCGGGFASGRLTACMVAAGAIARKILKNEGIEICAYTKQVGDVVLDKELDFKEIQDKAYSNLLRCPDEETADKMMKKIEEVKEKHNSVGGVVECIATGLPIGIGEPLFNSAESVISQAMFSIPAVKGVDFGAGFKAASMKGSEHNDPFEFDKDNNIITTSNNSGGILGGITNSMPITFRIVIKPTASIGIEQDTINIKTRKNDKITVGGRHDPCIAIRVPPIAEAMTAIALLDLYLRK